MSTVGLLMISYMEEKPYFETRIRPCNADPVLSAQRYRFVEVRVLISIEDCPNLIFLLVRIQALASLAMQTQGLRSLTSFFSDCIWNTDWSNSVDID
jgi:hypothetical protein